MKNVIQRRSGGRGRKPVLAVGALIMAVAVSFASAGCGGTASSASSSTTTTSSTAPAMTGSTKMSTSPGSLPKPVPTQTLGARVWQGMEILAQATTPLPFVVFNGKAMTTVKPPKHASMHLMVMLSDKYTGLPIPYSSVWATIQKQGKIVYDERQWPMLSRYMGPHYGGDVALPGAGTYTLSLLVSPPVAARHMEYDKVWLKPHRVTMTFHWAGA